MKNDESRKRVPAGVTVWLTCGCSVRLKDSPMNYRVRYPCPSNLGHGYRLRWTRWQEGGKTGYNPEVSQ